MLNVTSNYSMEMVLDSSMNMRDSSVDVMDNSVEVRLVSVVRSCKCGFILMKNKITDY